MDGTVRGHWLLAGFVALLLNSAYLWAFATPTLWYFVQVAAHPLLGLALAAATLWLIVARRFRPSTLGQVALAIAGIKALRCSSRSGRGARLTEGPFSDPQLPLSDSRCR